ATTALRSTIKRPKPTPSSSPPRRTCTPRLKPCEAKLWAGTCALCAPELIAWQSLKPPSRKPEVKHERDIRRFPLLHRPPLRRGNAPSARRLAPDGRGPSAHR